MNDNGGPSRPVDNSAELARQVQQWKDIYSAEVKVVKDESNALKAKYTLEVKKHAKTTTDLANEKAAKNALLIEMKHHKEFKDATEKHLNDRIAELKEVQKQYMGKVLGGPSASQSLRTVQNTRLDSQDNTPTDARNDHRRFERSGSAHSPSR